MYLLKKIYTNSCILFSLFSILFLISCSADKAPAIDPRLISYPNTILFPETLKQDSEKDRKMGSQLPSLLVVEEKKLVMDSTLDNKQKTFVSKRELESYEAHDLDGLIVFLAQTPSVKNAVSVLESNKSEMKILETVKTSRVNVSGSSGVNLDSTSGNELGLTVNTAWTKLLFDGGKIEAREKSVLLKVDSAALDIVSSFDVILQELSDATLGLKKSHETNMIIEKYLAMYEKKRALIQLAFESNVIPESSYLELKSLEKDIRRVKLEQNLLSSQALNKVNEVFPPEASSLEKDFFARFDIPEFLEFNEQLSLTERKLIIAKQELLIAIELEKLQSKQQGTLRGDLSGPSGNNGSLSAFFGLSVSLPVYDGGEAEANISKLQFELKSVEHQIELHRQQFATIEASWVNFSEYYASAASLLEDKLKISLSRLENLEKLVKSGRSQVEALAKEILSIARVEISIVDLNFQYKQRLLDVVKTKGKVCLVLKACDDIDNVVTQMVLN